MNKLPAPGTRVRLNDKAHTKLGERRARNPGRIGTVIEGTSPSRTGPRPVIVWDGPNKTPEPVAIVYLEEVTA